MSRFEQLIACYRSGQTVTNAPTRIAAGGTAVFRYRASGLNWYYAGTPAAAAVADSTAPRGDLGDQLQQPARQPARGGDAGTLTCWYRGA